MRSPRVLIAIPVLALAVAACASDTNDTVAGTAATTALGGQTSVSSTGSTSVSSAASADIVDGPTLDDLVRATLAQGTARYILVTDTDGDMDALRGALPDSSSPVEPDAPGEGCGLVATDRPEAMVDTETGIRCIALPDDTRAVVDDRTVSLERDGTWTQTVVQFDNALAQLESSQLVALHDPAAVLAALSAGAGGAAAQDPMQGDGGLEYQAVLSIADVDDPFLAALAQRAGAETVTVTVLADGTGSTMRGMTYVFTAAAVTTGGANGDGTGGTTIDSSLSTNPVVNGQGGGSGSTAVVDSSQDDGSSTSVATSTTFEDVPAVLVGFRSFGDDVSINPPAEAETLNLGDLAASFEVDLGSGQG